LEEKDAYVKPIIEIIEFEMEDSIAESAMGTSYFEWLWED